MITDADHLNHLKGGTRQCVTDVAESQNASGDVLDCLLSIDWYADHSWTRRLIASHPNLSDAGYERLSSDHNGDVLYALASVTKHSRRLRALYLKDQSHQLDKAFTFNPHTPVWMLVEIAERNTDNGWITKALAQHPKLNRKIAALLVKSENSYIRKEVAHRHILTKAEQKHLAVDDNEYVRSALAQNSSVDPSVLDLMARNDAISYVRKYVASNRATTKETLKYLEQDENTYVRRAAKSNRNIND